MLFLAIPLGLYLTCHVELPHRRLGLWEITGPGHKTFRACVGDVDSDTRLYRMDAGAIARGCGEPNIRASRRAVTIDQECPRNRDQREVEITVVTFQNDTAYRFIYATRSPPQGLAVVSTPLIYDGRWLGQCPMSMKPGDVLTPDGKLVDESALYLR